MTLIGFVYQQEQDPSSSSPCCCCHPTHHRCLIVTIMIDVHREEAEKQLERQNNAKRLMEQNIAELTEDTAEKQVMMMMDMIAMMMSMMESM